jgi:hypothetical protein
MNSVTTSWNASISPIGTNDHGMGYACNCHFISLMIV